MIVDSATTNRRRSNLTICRFVCVWGNLAVAVASRKIKSCQTQNQSDFLWATTDAPIVLEGESLGAISSHRKFQNRPDRPLFGPSGPKEECVKSVDLLQKSRSAPRKCHLYQLGSLTGICWRYRSSKTYKWCVDAGTLSELSWSQLTFMLPCFMQCYHAARIYISTARCHWHEHYGCALYCTQQSTSLQTLGS